MSTPITHIVGKRNPFGGWDIKPMPYAEGQAALRDLELRVLDVRLRVRDDVGKISGSRRKDCQSTLDALRENGACRIKVGSKFIRRERREEVQVFDLALDSDGVARVPFKVATTILSRERYALIFEEVDDGKGAPSAPLPRVSPGEMRRTAALEESVEELKKQNAELQAALARLLERETEAPASTETSPASARRKNSKKSN